MKVTRFIALALAIITASTLFACSDGEDDNNSEKTTPVANNGAENPLADIAEPIVDDEEINNLFDIGYDMIANVTDIAASGLTLWDDGAPENLFDGNDLTSKLGGKELVFPVDITWNTNVSTTLKTYILYTGNDSSEWVGRSPVSWILYGSNDGENWTEIDKVDDSTMGDVDATPFGFIVDSPNAYTSYKLSITATNGVADDGGLELQLNEMILIGDIAAE